MNITTEYQKLIDAAGPLALRSIVTRQPQTAVGDLRELLTDHPSLGSMTLAELLGQGVSKPRPVDAARPRIPTPVDDRRLSASTPTHGHEEWNTRTEAGRAELDRVVLQTLAKLGGERVSAEAIRAQIGATPAQVRTSLNRHIEAGQISYSGQTRATRYTIES